MPKPTPRRLVVLAALFAPSSAFGWGEEGHKIVATIAWEYLTPEARTMVESLLKDDPDKTLADASTWADRIRTNNTYDWVKPLHYVNLPEGATSFDMQRDCPDGNCVVGAIERFTALLRDPNALPEKRREALKLVTHFVGDVHQPLHVSRGHDKGGNDIKVEFFGNKTNLHSVWDGQILRHAKREWREYADELRKSITDEQRKTWASSTPADWATESWILALRNAYDVPKDGQLGQPYLDKNLPVVEERLKMAGVRLAATLNGDVKVSPKAAESAPTTRPAGSTAVESDVKFVGSKDSDVYHDPNCADVKTIKPEHLVKYKAAPEGKRLHEGCPK